MLKRRIRGILRSHEPAWLGHCCFGVYDSTLSRLEMPHGVPIEVFTFPDEVNNLVALDDYIVVMCDYDMFVFKSSGALMTTCAGVFGDCLHHRNTVYVHYGDHLLRYSVNTGEHDAAVLSSRYSDLAIAGDGRLRIDDVLISFDGLKAGKPAAPAPPAPRKAERIAWRGMIYCHNANVSREYVQDSTLVVGLHGLPRSYWPCRDVLVHSGCVSRDLAYISAGERGVFVSLRPDRLARVFSLLAPAGLGAWSRGRGP